MMNKLLKYFTWELNTEFIASGYCIAIVSLYSIFNLLLGIKTVEIIVMLEMFCTSYIITIVQKLIYKDDSKIRMMLWYILSMIILIVPAIVFHWFSKLYFIMYVILMFLALIVVHVGLYFASKIDSKNLNEALLQYQENHRER